LINNMYVNPQLSNYIHTRSLSVCTGGRPVVNTYIFN